MAKSLKGLAGLYIYAHWRMTLSAKKSREGYKMQINVIMGLKNNLDHGCSPKKLKSKYRKLWLDQF
jgi:hypothetical protein